MKDNMYDSIVKKLGFEPRDYSPKLSHTENDNLDNPFNILTLEELKYLQENNLFSKSEESV